MLNKYTSNNAVQAIETIYQDTRTNPSNSWRKTELLIANLNKCSNMINKLSQYC